MSSRFYVMAHRVYRAFMSFLPREFRDRYGREMLSVFEQTMTATYREYGATRVVFTWARMCGELLIAGPRERLHKHSSERRSKGRLPTMETLRNDVRYALRSMRKSPGFTTVVLATLSIGIGANASIFSVVNSVMLRSLPYEDSSGLTSIWLEFRRDHAVSGREIPASEPEFLELRTGSTSFQAIAGYWIAEANLGGLTEPERVSTAAVSANFLDVLGVMPDLGRGFVVGDDLPEADDVVVLTDPLWRRSFGAGTTDVLGRSVAVNGRPATVIGVLPPSFRFPGSDVELLRINKIDPINPAGRSSHYLSMIGRLRAGVSLDVASAEVGMLVARWSGEYPDRHGPSANHPVVVASLRERLLGDVRPALTLLLGAVGLVLLIACANVANLMTARAEERQREVGIRAALGASRRRLVSQVMTESIVISIASGVVGLMLAVLGVRVLARLGSVDVPRMQDVSVDGAVLVFAIGVSVATGLLFGLAPAIAAARSDLNTMFKGTSSVVTAGTRRLFFRNALVAGEVGLAVVLVVGAALLIKSFSRLTSVDPGFDTNGVITMDFSLNSATYSTPQDVARFHTELVERVTALPGVEAAGAIRTLPLRGAPGHETMTIHGGVEVATDDANAGDQSTFTAQYQIASPEYFEALAIPLLRGRLFTRGDVANTAPVVVINASMAERLWPSGGAIGKRIQLGAFPNNTNPEMTIVGIVDNVLQTGLDAEHAPQIFVPRQQASAYGGLGTRSATFVVKSQGDPVVVMQAVRRELRAIDATLPLANIQTMDHVVSQSVSDRRFTSLLMGIFSLIALGLGAVGIYGLMSYTVVRRTKEIGLRIALGAARGNVIGSIVRQAGVLTVIGAGGGIVVAYWASKILAGLMFRVDVHDPAVFIGAPMLLALVALLAAYLPARRAAMVDPVDSMKVE